MSIYVVQPGDTAYGIAAEQNVPLEELAYANQLVYPYPLAVGQALYVPQEPDSDRRSVTVNGYAYPFISPYVLSQTLPFLTFLSVFSYGFTEDGQLLAPQADDAWMLEAAAQYAVRPILTLTPFGPEGLFSNYLIHQIVTRPASRSVLISQLLDTMNEKGYTGVDIDFEYILAEDRDLFTGFVREVTNAMHAAGFTCSVALAPKTSAGQQGLLYEGKDYGALGAIADSVLLMTYEWGYTYGPPMAVAPLNMVRRVVEYALTEIPAAKIDLGIPNYGYDWPLPYQQGITAARTIGNVEAVQIALDYNAVIEFDETARSPFFRYTAEDGTVHEVWFEDVRSLSAKFDLVEQYSLRGMGYWQIMRWFRANWLLLSERFVISE